MQKLRVMAALFAAAFVTSAAAQAGDRFAAFNSTTGTTFSGVFLAPAGTTAWGPNQTLSEHDHTLEPSERLRLKGIAHGVYDVRLVDSAGHSCIKRGVDLTHETSFEIRESDLAACR